MVVAINIEKVLQDMGHTVAYTGKKRGDYLRLAATAADSAILRRYCQEAYAHILQTLQGVVTDSAASDGEYVLTLRAENGSNAAIAETVRHGLHTYMALALTAKWLMLSQTELARDYESVAQTMLDGVRRTLEAPGREHFAPFTRWVY